MRILFLLCFIAISFSTYAQRPFSRDFWLNETNTPVKVNAIAEDAAGYIWVGTDNGLYRFNGRDFTFIRDSIHKLVTAVTCADDIIYIGYANGKVARQINGIITPIAIQNRAPQTVINNIYADPSGILWLCTEEGIFGVLNNSSLLLDNSKGLSDNFTYEAVFAANGNLYVGTDNGINRVSLEKGKTRIERYGTHNGLPDNIVRVLKNVKGTRFFWVGMHEGGL